MLAMVLEHINSPLLLKDVPIPQPNPHEILIKVKACGVCRTDLHIQEGDLKDPKLPLIPGHQVVGVVEKVGEKVTKHKVQDRVGLIWLAGACGACPFCTTSKENLCDKASFTGYSINGGYAEYCTAHEDFAVKAPSNYDDAHLAPLLCAGVIGYRAFRIAKPKRTLGLYGFGSSAHILTQIAQKLGIDVYAFTNKQPFALSLGAKWAGSSEDLPPVPLDAAIIFAPSGDLYPKALKAVQKGGKVVSAGIHMSDIPSFPYKLLWEERSMTSVANVTRDDAQEFLRIAENIPINVTIKTFPLEKANRALADIKNGALNGSAVLVI